MDKDPLFAFRKKHGFVIFYNVAKVWDMLRNKVFILAAISSRICFGTFSAFES